MDITYRLYKSIEDRLLEKYLVEFHFFTDTADIEKLKEYNKKHGIPVIGDFKCYLPILFMVKNRIELEYLMGSLNKQLYDEYACSIIETKVSNKITLDETVRHLITTSINKLNTSRTSTLKIRTVIPKTILENELDVIVRVEDFKFRTIRSGVDSINDKFDYMIQFDKTWTTEE